MKTITVRKELLLNLGNFSNEKIIVEITTDQPFEEAWKELNAEILEQETLDRAIRLPNSKPNEVEETKKFPF
jgi:autonomous glycyl radical cofactor GrcA